VLWGADPEDPRLQAGAERLLESTEGEGGFSSGGGRPPDPALTARAVQALAVLGWSAHSRFQEALAWLLEIGLEPEPGRTVGERAVAATATLAAAVWCAEGRRQSVIERAGGTLLSILDDPAAARSHGGLRLGFPNLLRTDLAEILWAFARAGHQLEDPLRRPLRRLQRAQTPAGRWRRGLAPPSRLPLAERARPAAGEESRSISLEATVALLEYAVPAGLPRLFPAKPGS
jgi:hypothetical protein